MQKASLKLFLAAMQSRIVGEEEEAFLDTFEEDEWGCDAKKTFSCKIMRANKTYLILYRLRIYPTVYLSKLL